MTDNSFFPQDNEITSSVLIRCLAHELNHQPPAISFGCCIIAEAGSLEGFMFTVRTSQQVPIPWHRASLKGCCSIEVFDTMAIAIPTPYLAGEDSGNRNCEMVQPDQRLRVYPTTRRRRQRCIRAHLCRRARRFEQPERRSAN